MLDINTQKNILIVGFGMSGKSAYDFLNSKGHNVLVYDDSKSVDIATEFNKIEWEKIDIIVKSPAIPIMPNTCHKVVRKGREMGIPVVSTFDIFRLYNPDAKIIAITGTNGKSTTTSLVYHVLKEQGLNVQMGGNIGIPYFDLKPADLYVFEMSSYELASSKYLDFYIGCILNIEADHLEFHEGFENYVKAKRLVLEHSMVKLISCEDRETFDLYKGRENVIKLAIEPNEEADIYVCENALFDKAIGRLTVDLSGLMSLRGTHNHQNVEFAYAICRELGLTASEILKHMKTYKALPHRINSVRKIGNVLFVNDSKATNPASAARALATFIGYKVYWLVGGRSKKTDPMVYIRDHISGVQKIYLFGESQDEFKMAFNGVKPIVECGSLEQATYQAYKEASKGEGPIVVLLSPMCSSYDQFTNFEERGNEFVRIVSSIEE